jgi:hypothetical protein
MLFPHLAVMCYFDYNYIVIGFDAAYLLLAVSKTGTKPQRAEKFVVKWLQYRPILSLGHYYQLTVDINLHPHLQLQLLPPLQSYYFHYGLN